MGCYRPVFKLIRSRVSLHAESLVCSSPRDVTLVSESHCMCRASSCVCSSSCWLLCLWAVLTVVCVFVCLQPDPHNQQKTVTCSVLPTCIYSLLVGDAARAWALSKGLKCAATLEAADQVRGVRCSCMPWLVCHWLNSSSRTTTFSTQLSNVRDGLLSVPCSTHQSNSAHERDIGVLSQGLTFYNEEL